MRTGQPVTIVEAGGERQRHQRTPRGIEYCSYMLLYIAKYYVGNSVVTIKRLLRDSYSEPRLRHR